MFRGNYPTRVDEKGRLKLPAEFKRVAEAAFGTDGRKLRFYVTSRDGAAVEIYPLPEWEKVEARLGDASEFNDPVAKLMDRFNYYGQESDMDEQGRILIPQLLREKAKAVGEMVVFGQIKYLKVTNHDSFRQHMEDNPLTADDRKALAALRI